MHRSTVVLIGSIGFLCGIAAASFFVIAPLVMWALVCAGGILLLLRRTRATAVGILLLAAVCGIARTHAIIERPSPLWELAADKPTVTLTGVVESDFEATATGGRFVFHAFPEGDRVLVSGPDWIRPRQGQILVLTGKIQQPKNYEDFDYVSYLAKSGIHATMYFPKYSVPEEFPMSWSTRTWLWLSSHLAALRLALTDAIARVVPQPESGYLTGILVGAKGVVSADMKDAFSRTGTSHILAISGYNITIVAAALMAMLARFGRRWSYWLAVLGIVLFTIMVGMGASVVRAAIMGIMAVTAQRLGRMSSAGSAMALSAVIMCWFNPLLLRWDVGFQLSFLAFAGIVYIEPLIRQTLERCLKWKTLAAMLATTLAAQVLVLPILLYTFNQLALYTLPANVLVLPLVPVAMALGFATAVAGLVWPFASGLIAQSAWLVAAYQLSIVRFFASLPHAAFEVHISVALLVALYAGLAAWLVAVYRRTHA